MSLNKKLFLSTLMLSLFLGSCGEYQDATGEGGGSTDTAGGALIQTQVRRSFLIDGTTKSCLAKETQYGLQDIIVPDDVSAFYFRLPGVRIPPAPAGSRYRIFYVRITFLGTLSNVSPCKFNGDTLTTLVQPNIPAFNPLNNSQFISLWRNSSLLNVIPGQDEVAALPPEEQYLYFDCPLVCGGITIPTDQQRTQFSVPARLELVGAIYPIANPFEERPFRSETTITVEIF